MRLFVGSIAHETNAFSPFPTLIEDYKPGLIGYADLVGAARARDCDVVAGLSLRAAPSAPTLREDYEKLRDDLLLQIEAAGELDGVLLALHGAQVAESYPDCESDIVCAVRAVLGNDVIIGVLLDLHAAIGESMLAHADFVTVIKEYPHTDYPETARQLVDLTLRKFHREIAPVTAYVPLPLYTLWHTPELPSKTLVDKARRLEAEGQALHISLVHGFPWSDVPDAGAAVIVITDGDEEGAKSLADEFARDLWAIRAADTGRYFNLEKTLEEARSKGMGGGPLVIADTADNPGAGCGGDATWLLRELLDPPIKGAAVALLYDPRALQQIIDAGAGSDVELHIGGWSGALAGPPVHAVFRVITVNHSAMIDALPGYQSVEAGPLARIQLNSVDIVVGRYREQVFGPRVFTEVGIEPSERRLLVVKSAQHFYRGFEPIASRIIYCDTPACRTIDFSRLPFRYRRVPIWPLDHCTVDDIPAAVLV